MEKVSVKERVQTYWRLVVVALLGIVLVYVSVSLYRSSHHTLSFVMLDIGQGDALLITSPTGNQIIVDGGPGKNLLSRLPHHMSPFDRDIDMIIVTNPDKDHFEGFIPLLSSYKVGVFADSGVSASTNPLWNELTSTVDATHTNRLTLTAGDRIDIGGGAYIDILFPDREVSDVSHNDGSLVAKLIYGKTSVLLTGDSTQSIEHYLIEKYDTGLHSSLLKVAHHGSRTSTSQEFVKLVQPEVALISAGRGNMYGHPHKETLDTLAKENIPVIGTFSAGDIVFESDGSEWIRRD
jgi:competence protein ComEC